MVFRVEMGDDGLSTPEDRVQDIINGLRLVGVEKGVVVSVSFDKEASDGVD